jgi:hypothetical protein
MNIPSYVPQGAHTVANQIWLNCPDLRPHIEKLLCDPRMKDAYDKLGKFTNNDQNKIGGYFFAAFGAINKFSTYRENEKIAADLCKDIKKTADKLASLLDKVNKYSAPPQLVSARKLLITSFPKGGDDAVLWLTWANEQALPNIDHAWKYAPTVADCLRTVAEQADGITTGLPDNLRAAIASRKANSPHMDYLRNLWALLKQNGTFNNGQSDSYLYGLSEVMSITVEVAFELDNPTSATNIYQDILTSI